MQINGQVRHTIKKVSGLKYEIQDDDYTLLIDSGKQGIKVILPAAANNEGRVLVLKKLNADKYKLNSSAIKVLTLEGTIDISEEMIIKMNYSSRTVQSDGENWWIIGSKGT